MTRRPGRAAAFLLLAFLTVGAGRAEAASWAGPRPRLVLVLVVDQLKQEQLERLAGRFTGGFRTLLSSGAVFAQAYHRHVPTLTAPGHAAIITGRYPARHGIVANDWWDRRRNRMVEAPEDTLYGLGPEQLIGYTLGDALKASSPRSLVVAASHSPTSAVILGGKKADTVLWFDLKSARFATSGYYGERPAWLDAFNDERRRSVPSLRRLKTQEDAEKFALTPEADGLLVDLVETLVGASRLGRGPAADLLALSFTVPDEVGHAYGPESPRMDEHLLRLDETLGRLFASLAARAGQDGLVVMLASDHGCMPLPETKAGRALGLHRIQPARFEERLEALLQNIYPAPQGRWVQALRMPNVYLNRDLARSRGIDWVAFLKDAAKAIGPLEGVAEVYTATALAGPAPSNSKGRPADYDRSYRDSFFEARSGDLVIRPKEDFLFKKDGAGHGTPYEYDTHVPLIFWGPGIKPGTRPAPVAMTDAAPTLAIALSAALQPDESGRVLDELFQ